MNGRILKLSRRDDFLLFGSAGLFLWIVVSLGLDLFLGGRQFIQAFLEKCLAKCSALMSLSLSAAEGIRLFLLLSLFGLFLTATAGSLRDARRVRKFTLSLQKIEFPSRLGRLIGECGLPSDRLVLFPSGMSFACTAGLFSPRTYISTHLFESLSDEEVKAVILHEHGHAQRKDPLRGLLIGLLRRFFFFIPPIVRLLRGVKKNLEFAADAHCLALSDSPVSLASALVKMRRDHLVRVQAMTGFAGQDFLEERLQLILGMKTSPQSRPRIRARRLRRLAGGLVLVFSLAFLVFPAGDAFPKSSPWVCRHSSHEACCPSGGQGTSHAHCRTEMKRLTKADSRYHFRLDDGRMDEFMSGLPPFDISLNGFSLKAGLRFGF